MATVTQVLADSNSAGFANVHQNTLSVGISAGDDIIVCVTQNNAEDLADVSVTDSKGHTYALANAAVIAGSMRMGQWVARCTTPMAAGTDWIKFKVAFTNNAGVCMYVLKLTGMVAAPSGDTFASSTGTSTAPSSGTTATTAQADEVAVAVYGYLGNPSFTAPGGYSQGATTQVSVGTGVSMSVAYKILTAVGAQTATATIGTSQQWAGLMVTYKASSTAPKTLVPVSDISSGSWTPSTGGSLFGTIDETPFSDTDYDQSSQSPVSTDTMEVRLQAGGNPNANNDGANHHIKYRIGKSTTGGDVLNLTVRLMMGPTEVASWAHTNVDALTSFDQTLSDAQANIITDYTNLRLRFEAIKP